MDVMLREAVWPTTGPYGVEEAYRVDAMTALDDSPWDDQPYNQQMPSTSMAASPSMSRWT